MASTLTRARCMPIGAEPLSDGGVHFRVWAPRRQRVAVVLQSPDGGPQDATMHELAAEGGGYFSAHVAEAAPGHWYRFRLDDDPMLYPDPASRYQPEGVHGPSQVVDSSVYEWRDADWPGVQLLGQVVYEMHLGTFTPEGTWLAAIRALPKLVETGVTLVEVMPVADFPGRFGWGYDGVNLFAPSRLYGPPDDMRAFVDAAHALGLGVILDVVYNHFGPSGNYLAAFSQDYMHSERANEWGESLNFDGENSGPVREFFIANAGYWIEEFHVDGLRLDATQAIHDTSEPHLLAEISRRVRQAGGERGTLIFSENERQEALQIQPLEQGGHGLDAAWNDDFHHSALVAATGHNEYYYSDYRGTPQELISAVKWGYLFQGQRCMNQQCQPRGTPAFGVDAARFVTFLENHDQVANSARGLRVHQLTSPGRYRALTALSLLAPGTPLLFQGQEFASSKPFLYFADHEPHLASLVRKGRHDFLKMFGRVGNAEMEKLLNDPESIDTFDRCKLDWEERERNVEAHLLHRDLLALRCEDPVFRAQRGDRLHGAVLGPEAFLLRFFGENEDRLMVINLGRDIHLNPAPEPLLAPQLGMRWKTLWSSENPQYGGLGTPELESERNWRLPGHSCVVLAPVEFKPASAK